jgi:hypothetical protein
METKMILYHGSNADFDKISLEAAKDKRDFGRGFYTTTIKDQAEEWAEILNYRSRGDGCFLYEFDFEKTDNLHIKYFDGVTKEWLDFIVENRIKGGIQHSFDVVMGPVANDRTVNTIGLYLSGDYFLDEALRRLEYFKLNNQVSLHTEKALSCLRFIRKYQWTA